MTKVYFNELSARGSVDEKNVKQSMDDLVLCLRHLHSHNVDAVIADRTIGLYLISSKRNIYQILGDKNVINNDSATFLIEYFQEYYQLREEIEDYNIVSSKCREQDAIGLTLASDYLYKSITLSFSHAGWEEKVYNLQLEVLNEKGEITKLTTIAANASTESTLRLYDDLFPITSIPIPESGKILFLELANIFPCLDFSAGAKNFIKRCQSKVMTAQIFWKLYDLNKVASIFEGKPFEKKMFASKASPESGSRENMSELNVMFEDGIIRHCSWHLRYTPGAGRIHFSSDAGDGKTIFVGYVGNKIKA